MLITLMWKRKWTGIYFEFSLNGIHRVCLVVIITDITVLLS